MDVHTCLVCGSPFPRRRFWLAIAVSRDADFLASVGFACDYECLINATRVMDALRRMQACVMGVEHKPTPPGLIGEWRRLADEADEADGGE